jgi:PhnB protein
MPYLILDDVNAFIEFTKKVFGASEKERYPDDDGRIVHAEVTIGESTIMAGESTEQWPVQTAGLYVNVNNADLVYQKALDAGAVSVQKPSDQEYGRTCGVKDPQGNTWWITSDLLS